MSGADGVVLSRLKQARLVRRLNKLVGLPGNAPASRLLATVGDMLRAGQQAGHGGVGAALAPLGRAGAGEGFNLALIERLAAGLNPTACAAAAHGQGERQAVALPEPLEAVRSAAQGGGVEARSGPALR